MQSAQIIPFKFEAREVRTLLVDDQPWFVAADVSAALEYSVPSAMTRHLDEDEKGVSIVHTPGGDQEMLVINEPGLYSAILRSRKAEAKRFKKWVTAEVLPAIRKHGRYEDQGQMRTLIGHTIGTDGFRCLGAVLDGKLNKLPAKAKQRAKMHLWSQVHKAFSVVSAQDIPAEQMDSVRNFIAAYTLEGEWLAKADSTTTASTRRWLVSRDHAGNEQRTPVPDDACVMSTRQMLDAIVRPGELGISTDEMHQFAMAALSNLKMRLDSQSLQLKQMRASGLRA